MYCDLNVDRGGIKERKVAEAVVRINCWQNGHTNSCIFFYYVLYYTQIFPMRAFLRLGAYFSEISLG